VPARPPTRLRARVTAAVAMALIDAARPAEARRWCDEALAAARGAGSADEEADVLITLGVIEQYDDPVKACSLFAAGRAQAAGAGNREIELRALYDLAEVSNQLGDLATACAAADEGIEVADRTGLGWSTIAILLRRAQLKAHYRNGGWDQCERLLAAVPGLTTLAVAQVVAQGRPGHDSTPRCGCGSSSGWPAPIRSSTGTSLSGRPSWPAGRATWTGPGRPSAAAWPPPTRSRSSTRRWRVPGSP
jgi:hypothetical protein